MPKIDARKLPRAELQKMRELVLHMHREGVPKMQIVEQTGLSWPAVDRAITLGLSGNAADLEPSPRGRRPGSGRQLTDDQATRIRHLMRSNRPQFYGLESSLWTRERVGELIRQKLGVELSERTLGNYLNEWGITVGRKNEKPKDRCAPEVRGWLEANYGAIHQRAADGIVEIFWVNKPVNLSATVWTEADIASGQTVGDEGGGAAEAMDKGVDGDVGSMPRQATRPSPRLRLLSAVNSQGKLLWSFSRNAFNADRQIKFLRSLLSDSRKRTIVVVRPSWRMFDSEQVKSWQDKVGTSIEIVPPGHAKVTDVT